MSSRRDAVRLVAVMNKYSGGQQHGEGFLFTGTHGAFFEIRVRGHLDESWSDWLEGLDVRLLDDGQMLLSGYVRDQSELMGILTRLHNLNLALLSVSERNQQK
jgi:hypothetical protein